MNQWTLGTRQLRWGGGLPSVTSSGWLLSPGSRSAAPAGKWWRQASHGVAVCRIPPPRWDLFFPPGNRKWTDWSCSRSGSRQVVAIPEFPHELALAVYALGPWSNTRSPMCSLTVYPLFPLILWHLHDFINICTNLIFFFWQNTRFSTFHMPVHPNRNTNKHMGKWASEYTIQEVCVASWCPETTAFKGISHVWSMIRASKGFLAPPILLCILKQTGCSPPHVFIKSGSASEMTAEGKAGRAEQTSLFPTRHCKGEVANFRIIISFQWLIRSPLVSLSHP